MKFEKFYFNQKGEYYYTPLGDHGHGNPAQLLWVGKSYKIPEENLNLLQGDIIEGKKNLILIPGNKWIFKIVLEAGFRGQNENITVGNEVNKYYIYPIYRSPRGNVGIDDLILIVADKNTATINVKYVRSGRLYGSDPEVNAVIKLPEMEIAYLPSDEDMQLIDAY